MENVAALVVHLNTILCMVWTYKSAWQKSVWHVEKERENAIRCIPPFEWLSWTDCGRERGHHIWKPFGDPPLHKHTHFFHCSLSHSFLLHIVTCPVKTVYSPREAVHAVESWNEQIWTDMLVLFFIRKWCQAVLILCWQQSLTLWLLQFKQTGISSSLYDQSSHSANIYN